MDTKKFEILEKITDLGSLSLAAEALGLTQPAVSHSLAALEEEFGFALMRRSRIGARLTGEGEKIMPFIRRVLREEEQLQQTAAALRGLTAGTVRIATFTSIAVHWLPAIIREFEQLHPQISFTLFNGDYHDVDRWLSDGSADLGFITLPTSLDCECIFLKEDRLMAVLPPRHPLAERDACPVAELAREPFISLPDNSDNDARLALKAASIRPDVRFTTKDDYAILAMVAQGLGVSVVPELLLEGTSQDIAIRPLDPPSSRALALAVPAGEKAGPATRRFAEYVVEWVRRDPSHRPE